MSDPVVISAKHISFSYGSNQIFKDLNFQIRAGEMVTIVGPNGGGKTTLLELLLGFIEPAAGSLSILGSRAQDASSHLGYVPQYAKYDEKFPITVLEVVLIGRIRKFFGFYTQEDKVKAFEAMDRVGIADLAKKSFSELSGGQRQRVMIARALVGDPEVLLLDEPTANIDAFMSQRFYSLVEEIAKEKTVLFVTHDTGYVTKFTDRVFCINKGLHEHPADAIPGSLINDAYGHEVKSIRHDIKLEEHEVIR